MGYPGRGVGVGGLDFGVEACGEGSRAADAVLLGVEEVLDNALVRGAASLGGVLVAEVRFHLVICVGGPGFSLSIELDDERRAVASQVRYRSVRAVEGQDDASGKRPGFVVFEAEVIRVAWLYFALFLVVGCWCKTVA